MPPNAPTWWTDERVQETVDSQYINSHLRPDEQLLLKQAPSFGAGLTDDTYLDWILTRARRFFLVLVDVGIPDQIFGVVDDSYDDDDLPVAEEVVQDLCLSYQPNRSLDKRFYKTQFRYLIRVVGDGEHIRYAQEETVPVYPLGLKSAVLSLSKDATDSVWLPSDLARVFTRKRIALDNRVTEPGVLSEIASRKKYSHQHLISVYSSYLSEESIYVLLTPAAEYNLKSFLSDVPKAFENLPKQTKRQTLIDWPHCLANGLSWLHENGRPHGLIRPSNILVDSRFQVFFGSFEGAGMLSTSAKADDIEAYQYAAPERWKRAVTMQTTGPAKMSGHSGGRTARKVAVKIDKNDGAEGKESEWMTGDRLETAAPTATAYAFMPTSKSHFARLRLGKSDGESVMSMGSSGSRRSEQGSIATVRPSTVQSNRTDTPSAISSGSSGSNKTAKATIANPIFVAGPEVRTAMVQTWQSAQYDVYAADMFSLAAVILGIITLLCKRSAGSFERHRSSKNRTAGRGGGLADASFHANIGQVGAWANILQEDAKKKAKREEGGVFRAVGPMLQLVSHCLSRDPEQRLTSTALEKRLEEYIFTFANIDKLHCRREVSSEPETPVQKRASSPIKRILPQSIVPTSTSVDQITPGSTRSDEWTTLRSKGLTTATIPSPGPETSMSSLSSFNFEYDVNSDTVVEDDVSQMTNDGSKRVPLGLDPAEDRDLERRIKAKVTRAKTYKNWHNNDSAVDPRLSRSPNSPQGGFSYQNYSDSISSDDDNGGQSTFFFAESRRTSMMPAPQGPLPPIPQQKSSRTESHEIRSKRFPQPPGQKLPDRVIPRHSYSPQEVPLKQRISSLQPPFESPQKPSRDTELERKSASNSDLPYRARIAQENGRSFMKNL